MKKCEQSRDDLKEIFLDNIGIAYDLMKDDYMKQSPDELWENCFDISLKRGFYMFLVYKSQRATKSELQYLQKKSIFNDLLDEYYNGVYKQNYEDYEQLIRDYIKKQKKMEQTGDMQ